MGGPTTRHDDLGFREQRLVDLAIEVLAAGALDGLGGPRSRGAAPVQTLASRMGVSRGVVTRALDRLTGVPGATAVDLVVDHVFDPERNGERVLREAFVSLLTDAVDPVSLADHTVLVVRDALAEILTTAFDDPETRRLSGLACLLHAAAVLCDPATSHGASSRAARSIATKRRASYRESLAVQAAGLRLLLGATRRRPRSSLDEERIVCALQCLFDGYLVRFLVDDTEWPMEGFVELAWEMAMALTEPLPAGDGPGATPRQPTTPAGPNPRAVASDLHRLVKGVPGAWRTGVELLLASVPIRPGTDTRADGATGTDADADDGGTDADDALLAAVAELIAAEESFGDRVDPRRTAELLIELARQGSAGRPGWEALLAYLDTLRDPSPADGAPPTGC
jgi:hypothetical protein